MIDDIQSWLARLLQGFANLEPLEQLSYLAGVGVFFGLPLWAVRYFRNRVKNIRGSASSALSVDNQRQAPETDATSSVIEQDSAASSNEYRWIYQWQVGDGLAQPAVDPPLEDAIAEAVHEAALEQKERFLIYVRGELGIGKTTLVNRLPTALNKVADQLDSTQTDAKNFIKTTQILEARDLTRPNEFASEIVNLMEEGRSIIILARPATLDIASRRIVTPPDREVNMLPFEPTGPLFKSCLTVVANNMGLTDEDRRKRLGEIASRFDKFLKTPFYFEQAALVLKAEKSKSIKQSSPLEIFRQAIDDRAKYSETSFEHLVRLAAGTAERTEVNPLPGITGKGGFVHDGYRNVVLASAVVSGDLTFSEVTECKNAIPAVRIVLDHMKAAHQAKRPRKETAYIRDIREFVRDAHNADQQYFPIYVAGLAAQAFRDIKDEEPANILRRTCLDLIQNRAVGVNDESFSFWWDISDALSEIGDPRLRREQSERYFTQIEPFRIEIGNHELPDRMDLAKPLLPYKRTEVEVGPLWVANYLVTTNQFMSFWDSDNVQKYFTSTGRQWVRRSPELLEAIKQKFEVAARRNFWKERTEREKLTVLSRQHRKTFSPLELAKQRAIDPHNATDQAFLWDKINADERFSAAGLPVVGVNWWEAMAFCKWFEENELKNYGLPDGSHVSLLTDWEWEAIRRHFYEEADGGQSKVFEEGRYPAHTRVPSEDIRTGRIGNVMRPLHVGLSLPPGGEGPTDMVGNVWEWTRSRVFGEITECDEVNNDFGNTTWTDGDAELERDPLAPNRDTTDELDDLHYRAVRGGSFFSRDPQAAWHPAYRLCDPPFSSYLDLGFRIAVYPPSKTQAESQ
jgi:formylglycine-generating enzyme required for sulfatase activity